MAVIGALAAMLLAVVGGVKRKQYIYNTQAEMAQLQTAIERYKSAYGFYPPSNAKSALTNQLYYELTGTTNTGIAYQSLDGSPPPVPLASVQTAFGVGGFMNCTKTGAGEDSTKARNFLPDLKPKQTSFFTNGDTGVQGVNILVSSVGGPDQTYQPLLGLPDINPWRYNSSNPTNNPGAYDLWVQLVIGGKTNLICNWSKQVQINNPLP